MSAIRIPKADAIVFQLVRRDLRTVNSKWEEVRVVALAVKPSDLSYSYGSRAAITQTTPNQSFMDRYGETLPRVTMSGTFGVQVRRVGISVKTGYTRLLEFRDEIFKRSQLARPLKKDMRLFEFIDTDSDITPPKKGARYVYVINYYDFIYDQQYAINIDSLNININAKVNPFEPRYSMSFTCIGEVITMKTEDGLLKILKKADELITKAQQSANALEAAGGKLEIVSGVVGYLDVLGDTIESLSVLGSLYASAISGAISAIASAPAAASSKVTSIPDSVRM